ncbi:hypothetical protein C8R42DRAFT_572552, partial [Lentinula raphanica]
KSAVLGKRTLAAIREDMERLYLPSWMAAAPSRPGEASQGKFSADQWRTFCTVNLPVTLIRLWGSQPPGDRRHKMLVNYMHLVTSVRLADMRATTEEQIQSFEHHYRAYVTTLVGFGDRENVGGLYPHTRITPYQHMMLHFGDLLRRFGPVHSWRCFPFERFNYILQTTKTNSRFGELEETMFTRFCMMQKLKSLFRGGTFPTEALELATLYQTTLEKTDVRGTRINDALAFEEEFDTSSSMAHCELPERSSSSLSKLSPSVFAKLAQYASDGERVTSARVHSRIKRRGATFTSQNHSFSNAQVVFTTKCAEEWSAGSIKEIFTAIWETPDGKHVSKTFAEICPYKPLTTLHAHQDHYRTFGFAGGRLFYDTFKKETLLLPLDQILSHFAYSLQVVAFTSEPTMHALPLNKVISVEHCLSCVLISFGQENEIVI